MIRSGICAVDVSDFSSQNVFHHQVHAHGKSKVANETERHFHVLWFFVSNCEDHRRRLFFACLVGSVTELPFTISTIVYFFGP